MKLLPVIMAGVSIVAMGAVGLHRIDVLEKTVDKLSGEVGKQTVAITELATTMNMHLAKDTFGPGRPPVK